MSDELEVTTLNIDCYSNGDTKVTVWCKCRSSSEIEDIIEWLKLAETMMRKWDAIRKAEE